MGIKKGDKISLVGLNSVRYLTLDVAIGLIGAISVPLYYTSPLFEIGQIIKSSNSKILFIGAPKILDKLADKKLSIPIIAFCDITETKKTSDIINWRQFI